MTPLPYPASPPQDRSATLLSSCNSCVLLGLVRFFSLLRSSCCCFSHKLWLKAILSKGGCTAVFKSLFASATINTDKESQTLGRPNPLSLPRNFRRLPNFFNKFNSPERALLPIEVNVLSPENQGRSIILTRSRQTICRNLTCCNNGTPILTHNSTCLQSAFFSFVLTYLDAFCLQSLLPQQANLRH